MMIILCWWMWCLLEVVVGVCVCLWGWGLYIYETSDHFSEGHFQGRSTCSTQCSHPCYIRPCSSNELRLQLWFSSSVTIFYCLQYMPVTTHPSCWRYTVCWQCLNFLWFWDKFWFRDGSRWRFRGRNTLYFLDMISHERFHDYQSSLKLLVADSLQIKEDGKKEESDLRYIFSNLCWALI